MKIYLDGEEISNKISDWKLQSKSNQLSVIITYLSGKKYHACYNRCEIEPTIKMDGKYAILNNGNTVSQIKNATFVGGKYILYQYDNDENNCDKVYFKKKSDITITSGVDLKTNTLYDYFNKIIEERLENSSPDNEKIYASVKRQSDSLSGYSGTALYAYLTKKSVKRELPKDLIFPFGLNMSQLRAIEAAFSSQISIIEGPPGTGKTQTILNIIANILLQKGNVAIISNNNTAVENIYEKMEKAELGYLVAKLGKDDNATEFFDNLILQNTPDLQLENNVGLAEINELKNILEKLFTAKLELAALQEKLTEFETEKIYYENWLKENSSDVNVPGKFTLLNRGAKQIINFVTFLQNIPDGAISFWTKLILFFKFRILDTKDIQISDNREIIISQLQYIYYEKSIKETSTKIKKLSSFLVRNNYDITLKELTDKSMLYLKGFLSNARKDLDNCQPFTQKHYKKNFDAFIKRYPIIGSTSFSIKRSLDRDFILDYLIIDEASQQDIVPGFIPLGIAKNVIVVGDSKQLPHISMKTDIVCPDEDYNCVKYSLLDSLIRVFDGQISITQLREHYRCHPKIIQFCNKQFYDNKLIPIVNRSGGSPLHLIVTAKGNHARKNHNTRELESYIEIEEKINEGISFDEETSTGFIAPFNDQVNKSKDYLPEEYVQSTVHKFQGKECDHIIFSTVLDKKRENIRKIDFVDNPYLINVAVSRAKDKFTLVTGQDVFKQNDKSLAALVRYMRYYADEEDIFDNPVISSFDLLYTEYDESLEALKKKLRYSDSKWKSEQIVASHLRDIMCTSEFNSMKFHRDVRLKQIVSSNISLTPEEAAFIKTRAHCDFVISYKVGNVSIVVIEVDGSQHDEPIQQERDRKKDGILEKAGLPVLRLKTETAHIEERIINFLRKSIHYKK
jgi:superfamily I DNA and/or RNA helicase/very-short-patch-repair endonuclease